MARVVFERGDIVELPDGQVGEVAGVFDPFVYVASPTGGQHRRYAPSRLKHVPPMAGGAYPSSDPEGKYDPAELSADERAEQSRRELAERIATLRREPDELTGSDAARAAAAFELPDGPRCDGGCACGGDIVIEPPPPTVGELLADDANPKDALGVRKAPLRFVPPALTIHASDAMAQGAEKYGPYNWREKSVKAMVYAEAMQRHLAAFIDGQDCAEDSGAHHLGHVAACCGIVLDALGVGNLIDDRPVSGPAADLLRARDKTVEVCTIDDCPVCEEPDADEWSDDDEYAQVEDTTYDGPPRA